MAISAVKKEIGILEFSRPSDNFPDQLLSTNDHKNIKNAIVEMASHHYVTAGKQTNDPVPAPSGAESEGSVKRGRFLRPG